VLTNRAGNMLLSSHI